MTTSRNKSMKTLSVKLPPALDHQLEALAARRSIGKSALVREALSHYLASSTRPSAGSFRSLAADIAGCVEGPSDLSVSAKHLEGYGR